MTLTNSAIVTSRSILMHASLAHTSQELQTMDFIIQDLNTSTRASLPAEILIIIRGCLFPMITAQLLAQSATALLAYENSLRNLLCPDCVSYNFDIYGPDVWHWEQFSGACACLEIVEPGRQGRVVRGQAQGNGKRTKPNLDNTSLLNPKQFHDSLQWLEHHLSNESALRTIKRGGYRHSASSDSVCGRQPALANIWDVVDNVLRAFNCEVNRESDGVRADQVERGQFKNTRDTVQIIPFRHDLDSEKTTGTETDVNWRTYILLRRASRDLGLLLEYPQPFDASRSIASPFTRRLRWTNSSDTYIQSFYHHPKDLAKLVPKVFCFITSFAAAFLSLPITFATLTLTILCFYSKPRSFRIL
ncbi:hypothetical protein BYT27DRAFT_7256481 [Phlegmacium glaucopus]|nr:hypothetical protein BYT27DRAFT_7256481 [Phlegmacium glaucopus]